MQPALRPLAPPTHAFVWTPEELADIYREALKARIRDLTLSQEERRGAGRGGVTAPRLEPQPRDEPLRADGKASGQPEALRPVAHRVP